MSAAPRPQTDEQPADPAEAEGWALLESLRRRLDEQANQNRKTQTEVRQLAESIGALVTQQRNRNRWLNVNSFVAYVMFTLLCGIAFYFLYQSRARELVGERDRVIGERDTAVHRADEAIAKTIARDAADAKAWDAWVLLESNKREQAAKKLAELNNAPLSKLERTMLDARAKEAEVMQVDAALKTATTSFKAGRFADVVAPLEAALPLEPQGPRAAQMHYYLGVAYAKAGVLDQSITHLEAAVTADVDVEDARFHLASVLDRAGQWGKAKVEYDRFATAHPMSSYAAFAMRRGSTLSRFPAVAPNKAAATASQPGADGAPAQPTQPAPPGVSAAVTKAPAPPAAYAAPAAPTTSTAPASQPKPAVVAPKPPVVAPKTQPQAQPQQPAQKPAPKTLDFNDPSTE